MYESTEGWYVDTGIGIPHPVVGLNGKVSHKDTHTPPWRDEHLVTAPEYVS